MGRMQSRPTRWVCEPYDVALAERLAAGLGMSRPVGAVLARRGFADVESARTFLAAEERHDPLTLPGVPQACELILGHLRRGSRIAVFGDYDVDGVCSTAILVRALRALGGDPAWELPSRFDEGYGLSTAAVRGLGAPGGGVLGSLHRGVTAGATGAPPRRTSTSPRSPPCATSPRYGARTGGLCARAWSRSLAPAGPGCAR